jgi:hypothetical protein
MKQLLAFSILIGAGITWLTPACSSASYPSQAPASGWVKLEAGAFSLYAPPGWQFHKEQGIDSYVGKFTGDGIVLHFDYGLYSNPLDEATAPKYTVTHEEIEGRKAKIVSPRVPGTRLTAVYFSKVRDSDKLCVWANYLTEAQQTLVLKILRTIRFP